MKLNTWYETELESAYPYYEDSDRIKYISIYPNFKVKDLDVAKRIWDHNLPELSSKDRSRFCIRSIFE